MNENVLRHITHSHAAQHTGLVCVPTAIAVDPNASAPALHPIDLAEWLRMPAERRSPEKAVATCDLQGEEMAILITDANTLTPVMVIYGRREMVGEFASSFAADTRNTDFRAVFYGRFNSVINIKGPGGGGGNPGPRFPDPHHLARNIAFAELASIPTMEVHARRSTPGGPTDH